MARKTHCIRGHERTPENLAQDGKCKLCHKESNRQYAERKRRSAGIATRERNPEHCLRGHSRTADNIDATNNCIKCRIQRRKLPRVRLKRGINQREYRLTTNARIVVQACNARYKQTQSGKERNRESYRRRKREGSI